MDASKYSKAGQWQSRFERVAQPGANCAKDSDYMFTMQEDTKMTHAHACTCIPAQKIEPKKTRKVPERQTYQILKLSQMVAKTALYRLSKIYIFLSC